MGTANPSVWKMYFFLAVVAGCEGSGQPSRLGPVADRIQPAVPKPVGIESGFRQESCVEKTASEGVLTEVAAIAPVEHRRIGYPQDIDWLPERVVDLAALDDTLYVLDAGKGRVTRFTNQFLERIDWGGKGGGPGEFIDPIGVAIRPDGGVVVLDGSAGRASFFSSDGDFQTSFAVSRGSSVAVDQSGYVYVSHDVFPALRSDTIEVVSVYSPTGVKQPSLPHPTAASPNEDDRFVLGGPNPVRVRSRGNSIAVLYPVAGRVDVYDKQKLVERIAACMPRNVAEYYRKQRLEVMQGRRSQQAFWLLTDAFVDGTTYTSTPVKDLEGRFHIGRYHAGVNAGSWLAPGARRTFLAEVRFGFDPRTLIAFDATGTIAILRYNDRP